MSTSIFESAKNAATPFFTKRSLREGFSYKGDTPEQQELAEKVARVMARAAGLEAYPGSAPYWFERDGEQYISYFNLTSDDDVSFRVTFAIGGNSQRIVAIDRYKGVKSIDDPDVTISILDPNVNIVKMVELVGDKLLADNPEAEDFEEESGVVAEGRTYYGEQLQRLKESAKKDAVVEFLKNVGGGFSDYARWAATNNKPQVSQTMFSNAKKVFDATGGQSPAGQAQGYTVGPANPEEPLYDEQDADVFEDDLSQEAVEKFEEFRIMLREMAYGSPATWALFVYGSPGIGKSHSVKKVFSDEQKALEKTKQKVVVKTGGIAGSTGLLQLLYDHKKGYILVLDDNDKILQDQTAANYLKGALNTEIEDRHVTYSRANFSALFAEDDDDDDDDDDLEMDFEDMEVGGIEDMDDDDLEESHLFVRDGRAIFESATRRIDLGKVDASKLKEAKDEDGESIKDFYFRSRMIFISNLMDVPPAVDDRCYSIDMVFDYEQIVELIEGVMDKIKIPKVDRELRIEVLDFLKRSRWGIEKKLGMPVTLTFRKFRNACIAWEAAARNGLPAKKQKKWAMKQLRGAGGKKK